MTTTSSLRKIGALVTSLVLLSTAALVLTSCDNSQKTHSPKEPVVEPVLKTPVPVPAVTIGTPDEPTALDDPENWPNFGRTPGEQHYSPLDQINIDNVSQLSLAWHYDLAPGNTLSGPVAADGKLFITTGNNHIRAFEAVTGKLLWEFDAGVRELKGRTMRVGWGSKGIAYWNGRIFLLTEDGRLIALDANSGDEVWQQREFGLTELRYSYMPPRVFDGKVIVGHGGADLSAIRGYATAYDATTGERLWRFYTVPGNPADGFESEAMKMAAKTWKGDWWKHGGGGTVWNAVSYDPELDYVYIGVGNGFPYNQAIRSPGGGDNLFLSSVVAVKADTGEYVWHYQTSPGEQWDHTAVQDMSLATLFINGEERKVLLQAPKNGFFYVLDRATGELISAEPFAKVNWAERIDAVTGRPVENPAARYHGKEMFEIWPGGRGAHSWLPQAYSPRTGLVYLPVIEGATIIGDKGIDLSDPAKAGMGVYIDSDPNVPGARRSFLKAWDPVRQEARWSIELPGNWPGGIMATGGDLVFQGKIDRKFVAYDARDGKELWQFETAAPVVAPPISYSVGGIQYVTVLTGNGATGGGILAAGLQDYRTDYRLPRRVLTFALNGKGEQPKIEPLVPLTALDDPDYEPNPELEAQGAMAFAMNACLVCHGSTAIGGGAAPDLRVSPMILNKEGFNAVVREGALLKAGMPPAPEITPDQLAAIRQYLRKRARQLRSDDPGEEEKAQNIGSKGVVLPRHGG